MVFFIFIQTLIETFLANSGDPDQTPRFVATDQGLHCLPMSYKNAPGLYGLKKAECLFRTAF